MANQNAKIKTQNDNVKIKIWGKSHQMNDKGLLISSIGKKHAVPVCLCGSEPEFEKTKPISNGRIQNTGDRIQKKMQNEPNFKMAK